MKIFVLLILLLSNSSNTYTSLGRNDDEPILYIYADKLPQFNHNSEGLHEYIYKNLQWPYQADAEGTVLVSFIIKKDGKVTNVKIEKSLIKEFDDEAIRIFESMPNWEPGEKNSKQVDVKMFFPVIFKIKK
jgi:TonB family protein